MNKNIDLKKIRHFAMSAETFGLHANHQSGVECGTTCPEKIRP